MPVQDYTIYTKNAYKGQIAYASEPRTVTSGNAEVDLGYGLALKKGATAKGVVVGHTAGNVKGVSIRELNHEAKFKPSTGVTNYLATETVSVLKQGTINLLVTVRAVTRDSKLNVVDATGEFTGGSAIAGETQSLNVVALEDGAAGDTIKARIDIVA